MEEDMMMNVPSAPDMQGTPMPPDLSGQMQPQTEEVSQAEMQEAQGALMQIIQVINTLIEQGLNEEQIRAFLEQYGISEDELDQAGQLLGVDIDSLLGGQMQAPQEPMMMAAGGPGDKRKFELQTQIMQRPQTKQFVGMSDNEPMMQDRSVDNQIFTLQSQITNLMNNYNIAVRDQDFDTAQAIADQINNIDVAITQLQSQMPMMAAGGGTDSDEAGNPIVVTSPSTQVDTFMGPLEETGINFDTNMPTLQDTGMRVDASEIPAPSVKINVDYLNFMQPNGVLDERSYGDAIQRAKEMEQSVQELLMNYEKAIQAAKGNEKENLIKNLEEYVSTIQQPNMTIFSPSLVEKKKLNNSFAKGGPNDLPDVGSIEPFSPLDPSFAGGEYIDPRFGDPVEKILKKAFGVGTGLVGFAAEAIGPGKKIKILKNQYSRLLKAEKLEFDPGSSKDILEAYAIRKSIPYNSSQEIADEISKLEGRKPLDPKLLEKLRKEFDI